MHKPIVLVVILVLILVLIHEMNGSYIGNFGAFAQPGVVGGVDTPGVQRPARLGFAGELISIDMDKRCCDALGNGRRPVVTLVNSQN